MASDVTVVRDAVRELGPGEFTRAVAAVWEAMGWETRTVQGRTDDEAVIARRSGPDREKQVVRAVEYASGATLDARDVRESADRYRHVPDADAVVLVTARRIDEGARDVARDADVRLVDGDEFARLYYAYVWEPSGDEGSAAERPAPDAGHEPDDRPAASRRSRLPGSRIGTASRVLDALALGYVAVVSGLKRLGNGSIVEGLFRLLLAGVLLYLVARVVPAVLTGSDVPFPVLVA